MKSAAVAMIMGMASAMVLGRAGGAAAAGRGAAAAGGAAAASASCIVLAAAKSSVLRSLDILTLSSSFPSMSRNSSRISSISASKASTSRGSSKPRANRCEHTGWPSAHGQVQRGWGGSAHLEGVDTVVARERKHRPEADRPP